ncbi:testis anion transporter 1 isoform X6 [Rhinolophus sinicus]|uniref:testis anion transporter 1 isoform X6 n=1 Tax=Rhinolophus sinicus TaxID=89399 RepID=UPI003D7BBCD8
MMQPERRIQSADSKYKGSFFTYDVKRHVYNEETFHQEHRRRTASSGNVDIDITTVSHHVQCRCSWHRFLRCMLTVFPFLDWMCLYRIKDWLLGDLLAGINVGLVQVPQVLTLSLLTRQLIPPLNVSYAAFCSTVIYVIFGSCHQMSIGPFFLVSALMINVLKLYPFNSGHLIMGTFIKDDFSNPLFYMAYNRSLSVVATTTFLAGIIQLSMGMLGFGFIATYLPEAAISAYLAATALHIIASQMTCIFGIMISFHTGLVSFFYNIVNYCMSLPKANSTSILLFLTAVVVLRMNKCIRISFNQYPIEFPMEVFLDLIAIGLCNVVSSFFRCCVFTGAVVRTIIQNKSGGRQQFASLVGGGVMLLLMVKVGHFFLELPNAVLAGIILSNVLPYLETISHLPNLWRQSQYDCIIWMVTFMSAIILGLDIGLLVSVAFTFFLITVQSHRTKILLLGQIPNTNIYRSINDYREATSIPGVKIFQCCNSITFVNVHHLKDKLLNEVGMVRVPLKEEEVFLLFNRRGDDSQERKLCQCSCNCDELEPPPRVVYTERFESKPDHDTSSFNLIRCSRLESGNASHTSSDEQIPYTAASTFQKNQGQNYEDEEKVWFSYNPSRNDSMPLPGASASQVRSRSLMPCSESSLLPSIHTIILDFSMVHFVDSRASVVLRQMCNAFQNANILVLIAGSHFSVVRTFETNDFFDAGITKAQLFLSLHDAVLFALSRKFPEPSELSMDESETVIQETYSETDKDSESRHEMSSMIPEAPQNVRSSFRRIPDTIIEEESELDMETEPMLESEQETELDPECELEPESELEPETEPEPEPEPKPRPRAQTFPRQPYWPLYQPTPPSSPSQTRPRTQSAQMRRQHKSSYSPTGADTEEP